MTDTTDPVCRITTLARDTDAVAGELARMLVAGTGPRADELRAALLDDPQYPPAVLIDPDGGNHATRCETATPGVVLPLRSPHAPGTRLVAVTEDALSSLTDGPGSTGIDVLDVVVSDPCDTCGHRTVRPVDAD